MRHRVRLTENDIHRIVREAIESYDWEDYESNPKLVKSLQNKLSWEEKDNADDEAMDYMNIHHFSEKNPRVRKYNSSYPAYHSVYDNGVNGADRDYNDEYFKDSDYRFTNDGWGENRGLYHELFRGDELANSDSYYNKDYTKKSFGESKRRIRLGESDIYKIVRESVKRVLRENRFHKPIR